MKKRAILIVLDSVGIGALPDAKKYGDEGSNTLSHIYQTRGKLFIPNLISMGLGNIEGSELPKADRPNAAYGRAMEQTSAKDTTSGHWELAGLPMAVPMRTYPNGFPPHIMEEYERRIGRGTLCNRPASGTQIIQELGDEHMRTGKPIVYTSADSVFQVAAHEDVIPLMEQYRICEIARELLMGDDLVGRVIARPFTGKSGSYTRTQNRKDFSIEPPGDTILDGLTAKGYITAGIGKIEDIFFFRGIGISDHTRNNADSMAATMRFLQEKDFDFMFVNLVDFDMLYGHRNDVEGYAQALERFDEQLPALCGALQPQDLLLLTADHGCDPTMPGTDHSREYIPLLITGATCREGVDLGTRRSFADIGATVYQYLTGERWPTGESFLSSLIKE